MTRKVSWTGSLMVEPGRHVLLANALGAFAGAADGTWSGGLAATGGAIVLRAVGGAPIDAVGWGDAVNTFVEGGAAPAPAASRSIERLPGGNGGNAIDTNDNAADFAVNAAPVPQGLAAAPVPTPSATPVPIGGPRRRSPDDGTDARADRRALAGIRRRRLSADALHPR